MSGKPSIEGVQQTRETVYLIRKAQSRLAQVNTQIGVLRLEETKLTKQLQEFEGLLLKGIEAMDLRSPGNFGFENRFVWFLLEQERQNQEEIERQVKRAVSND